MCSDEEEEHTTDAGYSPDLTNSEKYHEIVEEAFELMTEGYRWRTFFLIF